MIIYANQICLGSETVKRITIKKSDIKKVSYKLDHSKGLAISGKIKKEKFIIPLKLNKNFSSPAEFKEYIGDCSEIDFETKEVPTKRQPKIGDIYSYGKDFYYVVFGIRDDIENKNDKRIDFLRIYQENLVGMDRNENLSFLKDMDYVGNSRVSINCIISSIESIISLTN